MKTVLLTLLFSSVFATAVGDPEDVAFARLSNFDYEEGKALPKKITKLDGTRVTISGFMENEDGSKDDSQYFVLVNDACGCEGTPDLNEMIFCAMPDGEETGMKVGVVEVTGTLYVGEEKEDGVVVTLYTMSVETLK